MTKRERHAREQQKTNCWQVYNCFAGKKCPVIPWNNLKKIAQTKKMKRGETVWQELASQQYDITVGEPLGGRLCGLTATSQTVCGSERTTMLVRAWLYFQDSADGAVSLCQQVWLTVLPELALFNTLWLIFSGNILAILRHPFPLSLYQVTR